MRLKNDFRKFSLGIVLLCGLLAGPALTPEQIEELLRQGAQAKVVQVMDAESKADEPGDSGETQLAGGCR